MHRVTLAMHHDARAAPPRRQDRARVGDRPEARVPGVSGVRDELRRRSGGPAARASLRPLPRRHERRASRLPAQQGRRPRRPVHVEPR
eukprot:5480013-Prymnesium_polylepis.1